MSEIVKEIEKSTFGLGLMTFTIGSSIKPQEQFNDVLLATIKRNLPNKTFINGGEFYGADDINLKYIKSFIDTYPEQRENLIISIKGAFNLMKATPEGNKEGINKSIGNITKYIPDLDIFEPARIDTTVPLEETIQALNDAVADGKIKAIALSEVNATTLEKAAKLSKVPISCVEIEFSVFSRDIITSGLAAKAGELGVPIIAYSPLSRGLLTGAVKTKSDLPEGDFRGILDRFSDENLKKNWEIVEFLEKAATAKNVTIVEYALAWVRFFSEKTIDGIKFPKIIDIPSTSTLGRVKENFSDFVLTQDEFDEVNKFLEGKTVYGRRYNEHMDKLLDL